MRFWAKTNPDGDFLPLREHLLDAGEVALRLFDLALAPTQRAWLADGFGVEVARARALTAFCVAAHDIGKVGPLQLRVPELAARLGTAGMPGLAEPQRHDAISGHVLSRYIAERGGSRRLGVALASAVGGHHGVPQRVIRKLAGLQVWESHQDALLDEVAAHFDVAGFADVGAPGHAHVLVLAGLVNACDWIASDADRFPVTSAAGRAPSAGLAVRAVNPGAWESRSVSAGATFSDTFGFQPRSVQAAVADIVAATTLPALFLIEDRTGSGKTEAALWIVRRALEAGARGMYVGLPTRATADQFHRRAAGFLDRLWPGADHGIRLLHGTAHLRGDDPVPTRVGTHDDSAEADRELVLARRWFAGARRGLLAPYAAGTIDQALQAVLSARFYPLRLLGVAGKVVVVDEAHAYDAYTGALLENLVRWLAALDATVVILSATLPRARRVALATAYRAGLGVEAVADHAGTPGYPRITVADAAGVRTTAVHDERPGRSVALDWLRVADPVADVVTAAEQEVAGAGCVAVVCSTVAIAQHRYGALRNSFGDDVEVVLLHSRIRPQERGPIEADLAGRLGPSAGTTRPERLVVVATQVVEQSLDLDFDVMLSDLAPVDLLVQRAGRVHRHAERTRPARHAVPRLRIIDTPGEQVTRGFAEPGFVYRESALARTRAVLRDRDRFAEPEDLDGLIEAVYGEAPPQVPDSEQERLAVWDRATAAAAADLAEWADGNGIGRPDEEDPPWTRHGAATLGDGDDPGADPRQNGAATRWSDRPSVDVVVLHAAEVDLLDRPLSATTVKALLLRAVSVTTRSVTAPVLADLAAHQPVAWRRHGVLSHHALAVVGTTSLPISWDAERGVVIPTGEEAE